MFQSPKQHWKTSIYTEWKYVRFYYRNIGCGSISSTGCGKIPPFSTRTGEYLLTIPFDPPNPVAWIELGLKDSTIPTSIY